MPTFTMLALLSQKERYEVHEKYIKMYCKLLQSLLLVNDSYEKDATRKKKLRGGQNFLIISAIYVLSWGREVRHREKHIFCETRKRCLQYSVLFCW